MQEKTTPTPIRTWSTSRIVWSTVFVVAVLLAFWLAFQLLPVILLLFAAIVLGTAIRPGVDWMRERGVLRHAGVIVIYFIILALLAGLLILVAPFIADQLTQFSQNMPVYYTDFRNWLIASGNQLLHNIALRIPSQPASLIQRRADTAEVLSNVSLTFLYTGAVLKSIFELLAVFLLAYYWTQEGSLVIRTLLRFIPQAHRSGAREFMHLAESRIGGYVRGQGLLCLIIGAAALVAYLLIGVPFALVLAIIAGLTEMIPIVGPVMGAIPAVLVALSVDPGKVPWVLGAIMLIQLLENAWLVPHVMRNSIGVNPIIIILSLMAFGSIFGFLGALLALPSAAMIQLVIDRALLAANQGSQPAESGSPDVDALLGESRELVSLAGSFADKERQPDAPRLPENVVDEINAITRDLDEVLVRIKEEDESRW
jgi:predicted PurR-regulated permease PerM